MISCACHAARGVMNYMNWWRHTFHSTHHISSVTFFIPRTTSPLCVLGDLIWCVGKVGTYHFMCLLGVDALRECAKVATFRDSWALFKSRNATTSCLEFHAPPQLHRSLLIGLWVVPKVRCSFRPNSRRQRRHGGFEPFSRQKSRCRIFSP
jgi:hypothetical protein